MFKKITEQPSLYNDLENQSVAQLLKDINTEDQKVALAVEKVIPQIERLVSLIIPRIQRGGRLFYLGAGTSGRLGVLDASDIPATSGMPPIGIAASGTTPYVIGALKEARERGILTGCITSNPGAPMSAEADVAIEVVVGPEFVTGSSRMKSGTAQKMILNMISTSIMTKPGRVKGNKMVNMQLTNKKLVDRGTRMLVEELGLDYGQAKTLLLLHGSVEKALEAYHNK